MTKPAAEPGMLQAHVEMRRARVLDALPLRREPVGVGSEPLSPERVQYFLKEAEDLYWNELAWEELTGEEAVVGGHLTELAFPAFLAFVDGLLLEKAAAGSRVPARPHPDVVEELLLFLAERHAQFSAELEGGADSERLVWARAMTARLIDLVLFRLYRLTPDEREEIDAGE